MNPAKTRALGIMITASIALIMWAEVHPTPTPEPPPSVGMLQSIANLVEASTELYYEYHDAFPDDGMAWSHQLGEAMAIPDAVQRNNRIDELTKTVEEKRLHKPSKPSFKL